MLNLTFTQRLVISYGVILLFCVFIGSFSLIQLSKVNDTSSVISESWLPSVRLSSHLNTLTADFRVVEFDHILSTNSENMKIREETLSKIQQEINQTVINYSQYIVQAEERQLLDSFNQLWSAYLTVHATMIGLSQQNKTEEAREMVRTESSSLYDKFSDILEKLEAINAKGAHNASALGDELFNSSESLIISALMIIFLISVALIWYMRRHVLSVLGSEPAIIHALVSKMAAGDLVVSSDINEDLKNSVLQGIRKMRIAIKDIIDDVLAASQDSSEAADNLGGVVNISREMLDQQMGRTHQIASAMEEMVASFKEVSHSIQQASIASQEAQTITGQGRSDMQQLQSQVSTLAEEIVDMIKTVTSVEQHSQKIGQILEAIKGIADQTNLLALNAAIEAARAGEQGRGFAVVADEVRTLAKRSQESTGEINHIITQLQESVAVSVKAMHRGKDLIGNVVSQSNKTIDQFDQIHTAAKNINDRTLQIATATEEQTRVAEDINEGVLSINTGTVKMAEKMAAVAEESEELKALGEKLDKRLSFFHV